MHDVTEDGKLIVEAVEKICGGMDSVGWNKNFTSNHITDVFRGSKCEKVLKAGKTNTKLFS